MSSHERPPTSPSSGKSTVLRQLALFILLIVLIGAFAYDRKMARPAAELAYENIENAVNERTASPLPPLNSDDIRAIVGKDPAYKKMGPNKYVEKYAWTAGLPWKQYWIWVAYSPLEEKSIKDNKKPIFDLHFLNEELPIEADPDYVSPRIDAPPPAEPVAAGASGGGGRRSRDPKGKEGPGKDGPPGETPAPPGEAPPSGNAPGIDTPPANDAPAGGKKADEQPKGDAPAGGKKADEQPKGDAPAPGNPPPSETTPK